MAASITTKQHDTRPIRTLTLLEQNPSAAVGVTRPVDLTAAATAKLLAKKDSSSVAAISNVLTFTNRPLGVLTWTPVALDTAVAGSFAAEVEITWNDGGIETYPNDGYFSINIIADQG